MSKPIDIRPERNILTKLYCFFQGFCIECGGIHYYRKYAGWQKKNHFALCYLDPGPDFPEEQADLFRGGSK